MKESVAKKLITIVSIAVPVVVAILFGVRLPNVEPFSFLPPIYASINGLTAVLLIVALWAIKAKKTKLHQNIMKTCIALSLSFLLMYVAYHMTSDSTPFGGEGIVRTFYFILLVSHILLSIIIIPLVLHTYLRAYLKDFQRHKKLARITFPIWLYVAVTGVVVYLMISPYYA
ncbi:MAG: DUF420 domain-containing protein [Flavobacteriaceae bacterium]